MRWLLALSTVPVLALSTPVVAQRPAPTPRQAEAAERIKSHYATGDKTQAKEDAEAAANEGELGLITESDENDEPWHAVGIVCFTPAAQSPSSILDIGVGDFIPPKTALKLGYAAAYNSTLVERANYPFRDLCRARGVNETFAGPDRPHYITKPARKITGRPRDLFDAARRGDARDVRRLITPKSLDAIDAFGMTPLAWAVARRNRSAIDALLAVGANPWRAGEDHFMPSKTAVYWAAALGQRSTFLRLQRLRGRKFEKGWPTGYLAAAMASNDPVIFGTMLAQRHDRMDFGYLRQPWPNTQMFSMAIKKQRDLATPLLFKGVGWSKHRPELVRMALAYGADPNALDSYESALWRVSSGLEDSSLEIIDMLLKAGADPNKQSIYGRPIWHAFSIMREKSDFPAYAGRARLIFDELRTAGADLNLPDSRGLPPIWWLLFPASPKHDRLESYEATAEEFEMLASLGLDVNAEWQGKRVMGLVEAQAGPDAKLTKTLRKLGAKP